MAAARLGFHAIILTPEDEACASAGGRPDDPGALRRRRGPGAAGRRGRHHHLRVRERARRRGGRRWDAAGRPRRAGRQGPGRSPGQGRGEDLPRTAATSPTVAFAGCGEFHDEISEGPRPPRRAGSAQSPPRGLRRQGPDLGRGISANAADAFERIGRGQAILEARADFARELSVIAARGRDGQILAYPLSENHHENGILRRTRAPAQASAALVHKAEVHRRPHPDRPRLRRGDGRGAVRALGRAVAGQRDRAAGPQFRPLDAGRLRGRPVRAARAGHRGLAPGTGDAPGPRGRWRT